MTEFGKQIRLRFWKDVRTPEEERKLLILCFAAVFCWGLAAHAYGFLRSGFSHDMLNALVVTPVETYWKMQLGRPGIVLYRRIFRGAVAAPWLLGILSLFWLALSCFLITKLFRIRGRLFPILLAGILTTNLSMTSMTAGFLYEMDANLFAVLLGVAAVFLWDRCGFPGCAAGVLLLAFCMGTYQSMISVPITLIMLLSITALLRKESFKAVFRKGLTAVAMIALGMLLYWLAVRLMCAWKGINLTMDSYNRVGQAANSAVFSRLSAVYRSWAAAFWNPAAAHIETPVLLLNILLPLAALVRLGFWLVDKNAGRKEKLLLCVLLLLLPLGMNTAQLGFSISVHDLMKYAFWLFELLWLLPFFVLPPTGNRLPVREICAMLTVLLLFSNVQTANVVYTKKDLEQKACLSLMTRVLSRMEMREDYVPGETPVVFVGISPLLKDQLSGFEDYYDLAGTEDSSPIVKSIVSYYYNVYAAYFRYILNNPAVMADTYVWNRLQKDADVLSMPCYPEEGCMQLLDGVLVVRLGEYSTVIKGVIP